MTLYMKKPQQYELIANTDTDRLAEAGIPADYVPSGYFAVVNVNTGQQEDLVSADNVDVLFQVVSGNQP